MKTFETLKRYLSQNDWAGAIDYLIGEEKKCPKDLDVSLNLIYCFGIFLTEMDPSQELRDDYTKQSTSLFARAYETFKFNPEFLFYAGWMMFIGEWNYGVDTDFLESMINRAHELAPDSILYKWATCQRGPDEKVREYRCLLMDYCKENGDSFIVKHGPIGEYLLECFMGRCHIK